LTPRSGCHCHPNLCSRQCARIFNKPARNRLHSRRSGKERQAQQRLFNSIWCGVICANCFEKIFEAEPPRRIRDRYCKILAPYRQGRRRRAPVWHPSVFRRGTCDRNIWTKPLAFAADAEGYINITVWGFNGRFVISSLSARANCQFCCNVSSCTDTNYHHSCTRALAPSHTNCRLRTRDNARRAI